MELTTSRILADLGVSPEVWENAGTQEQIMIVFGWGFKYDRSFKCSEMCKLLKLPRDVVSTVLDGLMKRGVVHVWPKGKRSVQG